MSRALWLQVFDAVGDKGGKGAELSRLHKACGKAASGLGPSLGRREGWTLHGTCFLPVGEESGGQNLSCVPSADQWWIHGVEAQGSICMRD